jgi:1,2-phenylacetyl-CoA epoxidase PaaB subunit
MRAQYLAGSLAVRGHLLEALQTGRRLIEQPTASRWRDVSDPFLDLALLGALPEEMAGQAFRPSLEEGVTVTWYGGFQSRSLSGLPWWAMKRDTAALALFGRRMGEAAARADGPANRLRAQYLQAASAAYLALVQGDTVTALSRFAALPEFACLTIRWCFHEKRTEAALLAARGEDLRAAAILDLWFTRSTSAIAVLARLDRGRIAERLNDRETAIRSYQYLVDAWRHADPELQPYVAEARNGLARLTGESR